MRNKTNIFYLLNIFYHLEGVGVEHGVDGGLRGGHVRRVAAVAVHQLLVRVEGAAGQRGETRHAEPRQVSVRHLGAEVRLDQVHLKIFYNLTKILHKQYMIQKYLSQNTFKIFFIG